MSKDQTRDQRLAEASPVIAKARALAAAGHHAAVVEFLGTRDQSELADPTLALLYGIAQTRLGRHEQGLQWIDQALAAARQRSEQGALDKALATADQAVAAAEASHDETLYALTLRGRAEVRAVRSEPELAHRELDRIRVIRGQMPDPVAEAEDLRIVALVLAVENQLPRAEKALREVIGRAELHQRLLLQGEATRDLAVVLRRAGRTAEAQAAAMAAKRIFAHMGAESEIRKLANQGWDEAFAAELRGSLAPIHVAQEYADAGKYAELLTYLEQRSKDELEESALLTLLLGIAHSRLGRLEVGQQWAMVAQLRARSLKDRMMELRALNVCGAIALERGGIDEATYFFTRAQEEATDDNDMATVGRCANNLGIIANMQGDYKRAVIAYTRAIASYEQAHFGRGVAEARHNLGIVCRAQGRLDRALEIAQTAIQEAQTLGDQQITAQAVAGLAEIHVARGEAELALAAIERAIATHRELKDPVREAEDLRIKAGALALKGNGNREAAETVLREVIEHASEHGR